MQERVKVKNSTSQSTVHSPGLHFLGAGRKYSSSSNIYHTDPVIVDVDRIVEEFTHHVNKKSDIISRSNHLLVILPVECIHCVEAKK